MLGQPSLTAAASIPKDKSGWIFVYKVTGQDRKGWKCHRTGRDILVLYRVVLLATRPPRSLGALLPRASARKKEETRQAAGVRE